MGPDLIDVADGPSEAHEVGRSEMLESPGAEGMTDRVDDGNSHGGEVDDGILDKDGTGEDCAKLRDDE